MTVIVTAVFTPMEGAFSKVAAALSPAIAEVHEEPGCQLYAIHEAPNGQIIMIEKWESAELLDAHGEGEAVKRLNASLEGLLQEPVDVTRLSPIPAGTEHQGTL
ncbi:antibiotic biosynthesis monooxygenase [Arthrobacter sp. ISL-48]|uniref:putative quinol monooxygenase n=1 Tax=Arthrobacter sp. ISL-48 TaxID=2819110 RepID=UPI001BE81CB9|nr:putative quinol monooxygenase [Arthrobacter sp. ISL-48]MBT2533765.1 antibiotic biosynthesis monooxygenase [Arthrobacter sp. ISL-48]